MKTPALMLAAAAALNINAAMPLPAEFPIARGDLQTRDPFVVVDEANGRYCLFRTYYVEPGDPAGDYFGMTGRGVQVSESTDLEHWSEARPVLEIPDEFNCKAVWAPEVHRYRDKWYIFTTLNYKTEGRGTWTFVSDDLRGPYRPMAKRSVTPVDWWCLDGTLWVEDGRPYMVFCHEWQQIVDGEMCYVPLTDDLSAAAGEPVTMFKASDGPHVRPDCLVTDGPFLERTADGGLEMIWSSHLDTGAYCVFKVRSESGRLAGPWKRHETIFDADGGHAMLFTDLQGRRRIALHSPNKPGTERPFFLPYDGTTKRELKSPDGRNSIVFTVGEELTYQIFRDGKALTEPAAVALELEGGPTLGERPKLLDTVRTKREEKIATPIYKKSQITGTTHLMTLSFADGWSVEAAARDDGVAFRHVTARDGKMIVRNERLPLRFASRDQQVIACADWACYDPNDRFQNSWEGVYHQVPLSAAPTNTSEAIWYTPVTFLSDGAAMCVTESDLRDYPGWCLVGGGDGMSLDGIFAGYPTKLDCVGGEDGDTRGVGERVLARAGHIAETEGARTFPWRVFMLASEPAGLIASDIVMALAEPASGDFSWVKPGKVAWEWWNDWNISGVDFKAGINTKTYEKYIDFAAEYGLEYVILDLGWSVGYDVMRINPEMDLRHLIDYGKARGVGIILWSTASQFIGRIDEVMDTYKALGAAGFKVDYMDRNDQLMVAWLEEIARHAAERRLVVDYHGMYKPTGLQRKYPNILNFEGVHGLEQMKWEKETTQPEHDCLMAYTRLAAGPLDYTPGAMRNCRREGWAPVHGRPGSLGTRCHQLGLAVILEAPLQMLCDSPTQYRKNAECARFLAEVPTVWDEIRPLGGVPGKSVVLARRKGDVWYVGAIGAWDEQMVEIDTSFLAAGEWRLTAFADGVNADRDPEDYARTVRTIAAGEKLAYALKPGGGLALRLERTAGDLFASGRAKVRADGTEMDGVLFHNVRNFWEVPEGGFALIRAPAAVDAALDDFGKWVTGSSSGVELRFYMQDDSVEIDLGCESSSAVACCTLCYGDFIADWPETDKTVVGKRATVRIRRSPHSANLRRIAAANGCRFDPDMVRLVLPGANMRYFGIRGRVAAPREDQLPGKTYLAYGSSITHGSIPLHVLHSYVERVAAGLGADSCNFGLSGRARMEKEVADFLAGQKFDYLTLEMGINDLGMDPEEYTRRVRYMVERTALTHPQAKILAIDVYRFALDEPFQAQAAEFRRRLKAVVEELKLPNVRYVNGLDLLTSERFLAEGLVHPSPEGQAEIADGILKAFRSFNIPQVGESKKRSASDWPLITIRQAYGPLRQPERTKEVLALHRRYPDACDEMWLAHGAGACLEDVRTAFEKLASYRPILEDLGIAVGFQQGVTLGHLDITAEAGGGIEGRIADFPDDIWQRNEKGEVRRMFCPRAPALHAYETEYLKIMGETLSPESIWFDDDLRLGLSVPGCFCDRCLKAFAEEWGTPVSREEIARRMSGGDDKDPLRRAWRRFRGTSLAEYAKVVRRAVDTWKKPPRLALQAVGSCEMACGMDWFPILREFSGADGRPVGIRAGHGSYREDFSELLPKLLWLARESERCRDVGYVASVSYEQENYRREILHKSVGTALMESALALFAGCDALTEYRWDGARDEPLRDSEEFLEGLQAWRPFYERISRGVLATRATGLSRIVGSDVDMLIWDTVDTSHDLDLQRCGIPIAPDSAPMAKVHYADGATFAALSTNDVRNLAKGWLIVDSAIVEGLKTRFGEPACDALASGRWKPYPLSRFWAKWNQQPTAAELFELYDLIDEMGGAQVRLDYPRLFRLWPRVDKDGRLKTLAVWNMSLGAVTPTEARVAASGVATGYFPDGTTVSLPIENGRLTIPALPPMGLLWIEF